MEGAENEIDFAPDNYNTMNLGSPHEDITEIPVHSPIITHSARDETEITSHSPRKKKRRKKSRSDLKTKEQIPETTITTVLNELQDDIVDEPKISSPDKDENLMLDGSSPKSYHLVSGEVYLQKNYGFVKVPRAKALNSLDSDADQRSDGNNWNTPTTSLEVAIFAQGCLKPLFTLCHGLLGGLSLATCIMVFQSELTTWQSLNLCRCLGAMAGWVLMVLVSSDDMLHTHLVAMLKYQTPNLQGSTKY